MSRNYKVHNPDGIYFMTFATVGWIDVFTRRIYKDIIVNSLNFCKQEKGLALFAWCLMTNHVHIICKSNGKFTLPEILRDFKKYTSKQILKAIQENPRESRKEWMLSIFERAGQYNSNNTKYQFWRQDNKPIELYSYKVIEQKMNYLHNNPVVEGIVENPQDYTYSSAGEFAGIKDLLELAVL